MQWYEKVLVPKLETVKVLSNNPQDIDKCFNCTKEMDCEDCDDLTPITCELQVKKVKMAQIVLCGIPIGTPYQIND